MFRTLTFKYSNRHIAVLTAFVAIDPVDAHLDFTGKRDRSHCPHHHHPHHHHIAGMNYELVSAARASIQSRS